MDYQSYLILFAPHAFASQRQYRSREPPSPPVFFLISAHFTTLHKFRSPLPDSKRGSIQCRLGVEPQVSRTYQAAYTRFTPNDSGQRSPPTYYRGCWRVIVGASSGGTVTPWAINPEASSPLKEFYNPKTFFPHAALLRQAFAHCADSPLLPPVGVWAVSQSQCG